MTVTVETPVVKEPAAHRRKADRPWLRYPAAFVRWWLAPVVTRWQGLSLTRLLAVGLALATFDLAHDWLAVAKEKGVALAWPFVVLVLGGFFLAAIIALGANHIDKLLAVVGARFGVLLSGPAITSTAITVTPALSPPPVTGGAFSG